MQGAAEVRRVEPAGVAVDDDEVGRLLAERRERGVHAGRHARGVPGRVQPRVNLALGGADHQHAGLPAPHGSRIGHRPIIQPRLSSYVPGSICAVRRRYVLHSHGHWLGSLPFSSRYQLVQPVCQTVPASASRSSRS